VGLCNITVPLAHREEEIKPTVRKDPAIYDRQSSLQSTVHTFKVEQSNVVTDS
jgi:hypothetical protein